jgi:hypothetical protein
MERLRSLFQILILAGAALTKMGCTTTQKIVEDSAELLNLRGGTLVIGEKVEYPAPLPDYYPMFREKAPDNLIAKGWDMDKDGQLDKIDVLGLEGEVIETYFDFDRDGQVDLKESFGAKKDNVEKTL